MGTADYLPGQSTFRFADAPPDNDAPCKFDLVRTPPKGNFHATIISEVVVGHRVHHWKGRTQPCIHQPCEACEARRKSEWKGWLWVVDERRMDPFVFEFPTSGGFAFKKIREKYSQLRGLRIETYRKTKRPNGPIAINVMNERADVYKLPLPGSIFAFLATLWGMSVPQFGGQGIDAMANFSEAERVTHEQTKAVHRRAVVNGEPMPLSEILAARDVFGAASLALRNGKEVTE